MEKGSVSGSSSAVGATTDKPFEGADSRKQKLVRRKPAKKLFDCPECNKSFQCRSKLTRHLRVHTGEKPFHCDLCPKKFAGKCSLKSHRQLIHFPEQVQKLPCPECEKTFTSKGSLRRHHLIHQGRKCHACVFCHKKFLHRSHLREHIRRHVKEKSYFCKDCYMSYFKKELLKFHRSGHTGDKCFKCPHPHCPVEFFYRDLLIAHRRQFHKEDVGVSYTCVFCGDGYEFVRKMQLNQHLLRHHLHQKGYFCKDCDMCFVTAGELLSHSRKKYRCGQ